VKLNYAERRRPGSLPKWHGVLIASTLAASFGARAQDLPPPDNSPIPSASNIQYLAIDSSAGATSFGDRWLDVNGTFALLGGINESGPRLRLNASASWYRFVTNDNPLTYGSGNSIEGSALLGYQVSMRRVSIIGLFGAAHGESHDEGIRSAHWGAKAIVSMYATPSDTTMLYSSVSYSTVANALLIQGKAGVKVMGNYYVGPEVNFSWRDVDPSYDNVKVVRIGGHVSGLDFGAVQIGVSAGWAHDRQIGSGYYGGLNLYGAF
jgi:hypothetical protein